MPDVKEVVTSVQEEIDKSFSGLKTVFNISIEEISTEMFTAGLISNAVRNKQSADSIIVEFKASFLFKSSLSEIELHCTTFFGVLNKMGGSFKDAGNYLKQSIKKAIKEKFKFDLFVGEIT